jgi:hypothetical protein
MSDAIEQGCGHLGIAKNLRTRSVAVAARSSSKARNGMETAFDRPSSEDNRRFLANFTTL